MVVKFEHLGGRIAEFKTSMGYISMVLSHTVKSKIMDK
jgi:hypothetical protein